MIRTIRFLVLTTALLLALLPVLAQDAPPKALLVDYPLKLYLTGEGPVDLVYHAPDVQTISLYVTNLEGNDPPIDTMLEVFSPGGESLAFNDDLVSGAVDPGIEDLALPEAGDYQVRLNTFASGEKGGVEVSVEVKSREGGRRSLGDLLNNGGDASNAALDVTDNLDGRTPASYTFDATAGQVVTIKAEAISPRSPDQDLMLTLYGPDDQQVDGGFDDDSGAEAGLGERDPAILSLELSDTGTYRVEVSSWFGISGQFRLTVAVE